MATYAESQDYAQFISWRDETRVRNPALPAVSPQPSSLSSARAVDDDPDVDAEPKTKEKKKKKVRQLKRAYLAGLPCHSHHPFQTPRAERQGIKREELPRTRGW